LVYRGLLPPTTQLLPLCLPPCAAISIFGRWHWRWWWQCVGEHSKVETTKNVPVHFSKLPQRQPQIPAKSVVDGQTKLRAKQQTEQPSQPRGHQQATSPTYVSQVTWGPSQVVLIPDQSKGSHKGSYKGSYKGSPKELTKDWRRSATI
jgi:hypothetical protein